MRVAITGATGSLGSALVAALEQAGAARVVALSRDEVKSAELQARFLTFGALRCVLGDVRDRERLEQVFDGCEAVIHAAALKRVEQGTYSPGELIKTNILGTVNVIAAAAAAGVRRVLVISSDKCVEPVNFYGMTKAVAEGYAVQANSYVYPRGCRVACVRYGNVLGSRGSVVHVWRHQLRAGQPVTITAPGMTRFILTLPQAAAFCLTALEGSFEGGEVFVPRLPAARLLDLCQAVIGVPVGAGPGPAVRYTGLRPGGEKCHEALLSHEEPARTWWDGARFVVLPSFHPWRASWSARGESIKHPYTSDQPARWLSIGELVTMLQTAP